MAKKMEYNGSNLRADMRGLRACLDQIHDEVAGHGMPIAATLIAAASEAIADEVSERIPDSSHRESRHFH